MSEPRAAAHWESDLAELLNELSGVQSDVLDALGRKRDLLVANDLAGMAALQGTEEELIARLEACHNRRGQLLAQAADEGLPNDSIRALAKSLPRSTQRDLARDVQAAAARSRLLQHQSLANWVVVQRTLLHLAQLLEIIATGGRPQPTYNQGANEHAGGSLVDQAA